jgi:phytoene synthase
MVVKANTGELEQSYRFCREVARKRARNFYYGFRLLPKPRRDAFCAVYAFMRYSDDVADSTAAVDERADRLQQWRQALDRALRGDYGDSQVFPALHDAARRYQIPADYLRDLITGTQMDLTIRFYQTFDDLYQYCYRVASVVGLCSLHMFGFHDPEAKLLAERCGIAFQLTNILRDLREDAAAGRIYLPLEDFERFSYKPEQLAAGVESQAFRDLMRHELSRARAYYAEAAPLIGMVEPESRAALWTLITIYQGVLGVIERKVENGATGNGSGVLSRRAALSDFQKIMVLFEAGAKQMQLRMGGKPDWRLRA